MFSQTRSTKKGQTIIADLMVSLAIFILLLVIVYMSWMNNVSQINQDYTGFKGEIAAQKAIDSITKSPGFPSNWAAQGLSPSSSSLKGLGCAQGYNRLDALKLSKLNTSFSTSSDYNASRLKIGVGAYDIDINISYLNTTGIYSLNSLPDSNITVLATKSEFASLDGEPVLVRVRIWQRD
jgi:hypothetical protein